MSLSLKKATALDFVDIINANTNLSLEDKDLWLKFAEVSAPEDLAELFETISLEPETIVDPTKNLKEKLKILELGGVSSLRNLLERE